MNYKCRGIFQKSGEAPIRLAKETSYINVENFPSFHECFNLIYIFIDLYQV